MATAPALASARMRVDHGTKAIGALRRQVLAQAQPLEQGDGIGRQDLAGRLCPETVASRMATSPRTMWASLSPRKLRTGSSSTLLD